jgi:gas vesicle protein
MATAPIDDTSDDVGTADVANEDNAAPQLTEVESLAAEMGWRPEAQYSGPKDKWKPAGEWIKTEREINRDLKDTVKRLRGDVEKIATASSKQAERMLTEQAKEIEARFQQAVENQDKAGAAQAAKDMRELEAEARPSGNRDYEAEFTARNPWYGKEDDASAYAVSVAQREAAKGRDPEQQLEAAEAAVKRRFPELFATEERQTLTVKPQPGVNQPTSRNPERPRAKTFEDMPAS